MHKWMEESNDKILQQVVYKAIDLKRFLQYFETKNINVKQKIHIGDEFNAGESFVWLYRYRASYTCFHGMFPELKG